MTGWKKQKLRELISTNERSIGRTYPFKEIAYLDTGSITKGKIETLQFMPLSEAPSRAKRLLSPGDIVYSAVRPINRHYGFFLNPQENMVVSTGFVVISCDQKKLALIIYITI